MHNRNRRSISGYLSRQKIAFLTALTTLFAGAAPAAIYQWRGGTDTSWTNAANWDAPGIAETGGTFGHRLNVNNGANHELVYSESLGTTVYNITGNRGLVIGSGALGSGTLRITGGVFSTEGAGANDAIGNSGNAASLIIDGGEYRTGRTLDFGLTFGAGSLFTTCRLEINGGSVVVPDIATNNAVGNINLNGGVLNMNRFVHLGGGNTYLNFNGGTLRARMSTTAFYPTPSNGAAFAMVKSGGAVIDTNGFDITIARPLEEDPTSPGGGLTKNGAGLLTLGSPSTITGPIVINGGGLSIPANFVSWQPASLTHAGTSLNLDLGIYNSGNPVPLNVQTLTLNATDILINISGSSIPVADEIRILDYGTKNGTGSFKLNVATLPANMVATLEENTAEGYYYLRVTSPSATSYSWYGAALGNDGQWDLTSLNWNGGSVAYAEPALVIFPSLTGGSTVDVVANVSPISFLITNTGGNPYTFTGAGKITGPIGITKSNTGIAIFNSTVNDYSGTLNITGGAVIKKAPDATSGSINVAADNVTFALEGGITDGAGQTLSINGRGANAGGYFFAGSAVLRGALQSHIGANTWQGDIVVTGNDFNNPTRIGVQNGASLTLTGNISEGVPTAAVLFRAGNAGDNITLAGPATYSYTGRSLLFSNGASIILGADNKLPAVSALVMDSGGTTIFDLNGFNQTVATLGGSANHSAAPNAARVLNNSATPSTLTVAPASGVNGFFMGSLTDGAGVLNFVKNGEGTQAFASDNTYTGTTTINSGTLEVGGGGTTGALNPASAITNDATLSFNRTNLLTQGTHFANNISGTGRIVKAGSGTLELTTANSYQGATVINAGTLSLTGSGTVGAGPVTLSGSSAFDVSTSSSAVVNLPGGLGGRGTVNATGKTISVGGAFSPVLLAVSGDLSLTGTTVSTVVAGADTAATSLTNLTGSMVNDGALVINAGPGTTFADGQSYVFFTATGGITSGFTSVSVGTLGLTSASAGVWTGSAEGLAYTYTEASGTLAVATSAVQPTALEAWRLQFFETADNSGAAANEADFDQDGLSNLVEYALGTDPKVANSGDIVVAKNGNFLTLTYPRRTPADPALTYTVLGSSDLGVAFTTATGETTNTGSTYVYTDNVDLSEGGVRRFLRLSITYTAP